MVGPNKLRDFYSTGFLVCNVDKQLFWLGFVKTEPLFLPPCFYMDRMPRSNIFAMPFPLQGRKGVSDYGGIASGLGSQWVELIY